MELFSTAFNNNDHIPAKYTCDGENISPQLNWQDVPAETASFALIVDDPDAPKETWVHWVLYNLPEDTRSLEEGIKQLPPGTQTGANSWRTMEYKGACPPSGIAHHYHFRLFALNTKLDLTKHITSEQLQQAMRGHILAKAELIGIYKK